MSPSFPASGACVACGAEANPRFLFRKNGCSIVACPRCDLAWVDAGREGAADIYDEGYFTSERGFGYGDYVSSERVLRREFRATAELLRAHVPANARVLEVGAAYGYFLLEARAHHREVVGVELAEGAARSARGRGLDVRAGVYDDTMAREIGAIDAAVMLDVIEHLEDPLAVVSRLHANLSPGGHLVLTTGDFGSLVGRATGKRWRLMTPPEHLFFFTRGSIERLLDRAGFTIVDVSYPWKLVPVGLVVHQLATKLGLPRRLPRASSALSGVGVPLNLFDAMRVLAKKKP